MLILPLISQTFASEALRWIFLWMWTAVSELMSKTQALHLRERISDLHDGLHPFFDFRKQVLKTLFSRKSTSVSLSIQPKACQKVQERWARRQQGWKLGTTTAKMVSSTHSWTTRTPMPWNWIEWTQKEKKVCHRKMASHLSAHLQRHPWLAG